ncbi:MAG: DUF3015 family protein [Nitrospirota bacterium]|nr:DUF3015 family protein [Nitrospirota bacterium]
MGQSSGLASLKLVDFQQQEDYLMRIITLKGLMGALVLASVGLGVSACNTSKATVDTFAKFTSSTSPGEWIDADGVIQESQKARLFAAVAFENLEQDIARGNGEYVRSLAVLMKIPAAEQDEFRSLSQAQYSRLFASDRRTAESLLATLISNRKDR